MTIHHITGRQLRLKNGQDAKRWRLLLQLMKDSEASITIDGFEFTKEWILGIVEYFDAKIEEQVKAEKALLAKKRRHKKKFILIKKT